MEPFCYTSFMDSSASYAIHEDYLSYIEQSESSDQHGVAPSPFDTIWTQDSSTPSLHRASNVKRKPDSTPDRSDSSTSDSGKNTSNPAHTRRKTQNRASQRAFRQRKESHVKHVVQRLEELQETHRELEKSHADEADKVTELRARVAALSAQLRIAKQYQDNGSATSSCLAPSGGSDPSDEFDEFSLWQSFRQPIDSLYADEGVYYGSGLPLELHEESW